MSMISGSGFVFSLLTIALSLVSADALAAQEDHDADCIAARQNPETEREEVLWLEATCPLKDSPLMEYMTESMSNVARAHALAHETFIYWYGSEHIPNVETELPWDAIMSYVVEKGFFGISGFYLPYSQVFVVGMLEDVMSDVYSEVKDEGGLRDNQDDVANYLRLKSSKIDTELSFVPAKFEMERPGDFEEAAWAYVYEAKDTPDIHAMSTYGVGPETQARLGGLGFPVPIKATADSIAEHVLYALIRPVYYRDYGRALDDGIWEPYQMDISARITTRRLLFPQNMEYVCADAWQLGMLAPNSCQ